MEAVKEATPQPVCHGQYLTFYVPAKNMP